jgi:hypothetical protein
VPGRCQQVAPNSARQVNSPPQPPQLAAGQQDDGCLDTLAA